MPIAPKSINEVHCTGYVIMHAIVFIVCGRFNKHRLYYTVKFICLRFVVESFNPNKSLSLFKNLRETGNNNIIPFFFFLIFQFILLSSPSRNTFVSLLHLQGWFSPSCNELSAIRLSEVLSAVAILTCGRTDK